MILTICASSGQAQTGAWWPANARSDYPRTLLTINELPQVQASLRMPTARGLYRGLWAGTQGVPPTDNTSASGRRARATFAKNAAFVILIDRQPVADSLAPLPPLTRQTQVQQVTQLLETLNPSVEAFATFSGTTYTEWQWRSKELIDYLIAYDLLRGSGVPETALTTARQQLQTFAGNLYRESNRPFFGIYFYRQIKNNHTLMTAAALGMAAVVLNHVTSADANQQPLNWQNTALFHLDNVLWQDAQRQSDPQAVAGYAEGPYYFKYAFLNCLPFVRALGQFAPGAMFSCTYNGSTRTIPNPYTDPRYERLYEWITAISLPDGRLPALEDSYVDMAMPELALTGHSRYVLPLALSGLNTGQLNSLTSQLRDATVDMRAAYLAALPTPTQPERPALVFLPQSGNLVFRSGSDSLATYFHLYGKAGAAQDNSGGHSQADASSFILYAQGQMLALDAGYLSYNRRAEVGQATHHNMILVDGAGPAIGTAGAANDAPATLSGAFSTPGLAYGQVQTNYRGATITRRALLVRNQYVLLADAAKALTPHTYTWQLHGYGLAGGTAATGTFTSDFGRHQASWTRQGASLVATVASPDTAATFNQTTNSHELTYNTTQDHTTLLVSSPNVPATRFLTMLWPGPATTIPPATKAFATAAATGLHTAGSGFQDLAFSQADTSLTTVPGLPQSTAADASLTLLSLNPAGQPAQMFLDQGTLLRYGPDTLLNATHRATLSWATLPDGKLAGYVSRATTLRIPLSSPPAAVQGAALQQATYDARRHQLVLQFSAASEVTVIPQRDIRPLPVTLVQFVGHRQGSKVLLKWQTAAEIGHQQFRVEVRADTDTTFRALTNLPAHGPGEYRFTDAQPPVGVAYYRLRQQDTDGSITYSGVLTVPPAPALLTLTAAPVPARTVVRLTANRPVPAQAQVELRNTQGQRVLNQQLQSVTELPVQHLPPGVYVVRALNPVGELLAPVLRILVAPE
ncbi:heparinase II/III domain-containing protein [Hymenobacter rigui]|uniref:heparinase II/III domain-containing protein n=1 Tax=Hymenobacter rigui TaxID=334424 RepID=UPI001477396C|nr:heparinase II/III family protein [Hymenobacter rigui]